MNSQPTGKTYDLEINYEIWESQAGERVLAQWGEGSYSVFRRLPPEQPGVVFPRPGDLVCFDNYAQLYAWRARHGWNKIHQFSLPMKSPIAPLHERGRP